jgi:hypothetical protein
MLAAELMLGGQWCEFVVMEIEGPHFYLMFSCGIAEPNFNARILFME